MRAGATLGTGRLRRSARGHRAFSGGNPCSPQAFRLVSMVETCIIRVNQWRSLPAPIESRDVDAVGMMELFGRELVIDHHEHRQRHMS